MMDCLVWEGWMWWEGVYSGHMYIVGIVYSWVVWCAEGWVWSMYVVV